MMCCSRYIPTSESRINKRRGFTLIELLIVVGFMAIISSFLFLNLLGRKSENDLQTTGVKIQALLREAQSRSVAQSAHTNWGVHFENSTSTIAFFSLFSGIYSTSTRAGYYALPRSVAYSTSTLALGLSYDITFSELRGLPSASTTIGLYLTKIPSRTSFVLVASSGVISRQ